AAPPGPAARLTSAASAGAALVHGAPVRSIRFSPDGEALVTASEDGTARIARLDGAPLSTLRAGEPLFRALPAPRGDRVLTLASPDKAPGPPRLWRRDGGEQCRLQGHREPVWSAAFSSDGERIAHAAAVAGERLRAARRLRAERAGQRGRVLARRRAVDRAGERRAGADRPRQRARAGARRGARRDLDRDGAQPGRAPDRKRCLRRHPV